MTRCILQTSLQHTGQRIATQSVYRSPLTQLKKANNPVEKQRVLKVYEWETNELAFDIKKIFILTSYSAKAEEKEQ